MLPTLRTKTAEIQLVRCATRARMRDEKDNPKPEILNPTWRVRGTE